MKSGIKKLATIAAIGSMLLAPISGLAWDHHHGHWHHFHHWGWGHWHHWHRHDDVAAGIVAGAAAGVLAGAVIYANTHPYQPNVVVHKYCHVENGFRYCKTVTDYN